MKRAKGTDAGVFRALQSVDAAIFIPYLSFLFIGPLLGYAGLSVQMSYILKAALTLILVFAFWNRYNLKLRKGFSLFSVSSGIVVFILWVSLDNLYPHIGKPSWFVPDSFLSLLFRLAGAIVVAPLVEELFVRSFLIRYLVSEKWQSVKVGTFTWASFIATVLFFGFSHDRWLAGIFAGAIFNMVLYREKSVEACIVSHAAANLLLAVFVLVTGQYGFW
ncbi:CAAX prenyl protease-related protein [Candidatus Woesearchaeota archaeon]|nr:MAG: CAAX prenyl protease-related protein [Candidatus Woesearchaeota archaeon]